LPSAETAEAGSETDEDEHSEELLAALRRWRARLAEWSRDDATTPSTEPALPLQLWFPGFPAPETQTAPTPTASTTAVAMAPSRAAVAQLQALEQRMSGIESTLAGLSTELRAFTLDAEHREDSSSAAIEHAIDVRFRVLSRVVQSAVDRLGAQLADEPKLRALPTQLVADERRNRG
jgi:hypothetical protein